MWSLSGIVTGTSSVATSRSPVRRPNDGPIDFDFLVGASFDKVLAGEFLDKVNALFFTVGVTLRW